MEIITLTLVGYQGFRLKQIKHFVYRPKKKTQVILGTNGSGKSRLLQELSPLPGNPSDYAKPGKKEIEIFHRGKKYLLKSLFEKEGNFFEFWLEDENLNPGRTVTVYKDLVREHFGYTADIHELMTGQNRFSLMSVAERRNWFTRISEVDYTYALRYYQRLKDEVRKFQGAIGRNRERLTQETDKCLTTKDEAQLRETVAEMRTMLGTLLEHRKPRLSNPNAIRQQVEQQDTLLQSHIARLERLFTALEGHNPAETEESLQNASIAIQAELQSHQRDIVVRCETLGKLQESLAAITSTAGTSLEDVQRTIKELEDESQDLLSRLHLPCRVEQPEQAHGYFTSIRCLLEDLAEQFKQRPEQYKSPWLREEAYKKKPVLEQKALKLKAMLDQSHQELRHLEAHREKGSLDCPQCHHRWIPNYDDSRYQKLLRSKELALKDQEALAEEQKALDAELGLWQTYGDACACFERLTGAAVLKPYWDFITASEILPERSEELVKLAAKIDADLQVQIKLVSYQVRLAEQKKLEKLMLASQALDKTKLEADIARENQLIQAAQVASRELHGRLEYVKSKLQLLKDVKDYHKQFEDARSTRDQALKLLVVDNCVAALDEIIHSLKLTLSQHERTLSQIDIQRGVVQTLAKQIAEDEADYKLLKLALKEMSPTEGLIARGMTGFINHFVKLTNNFIGKIWLYPMEIAPFGLTEDSALDLDYRFPVLVNAEKASGDVSRISSGMQEIIDLAFAMVSMKFLHLDNFPIFLDEFARSMDPAHRHAAYTAIEQLIDSTDYSQVFLVSHYQDGYSALTNSDILVLCDNNVRVPEHLAYNQHVSIS